MNWDDQASTHPDGNTPRGRSIIARRIMRLENRVMRIERTARGVAFVLALLAFAGLTIWLQSRGSP